MGAMYQLAYQLPDHSTLLPVLEQARDESRNVYIQSWLDLVEQAESREGYYLVVGVTEGGQVTLRPWVGVDPPTTAEDDVAVNVAAIFNMQIG